MLQHQFYQSKLLFLTANPLVQTSFPNFAKEWKKQFNQWTKGTVLLPASIYAKLATANKKYASFSVIPATIEGLHFVLAQEIGENLVKSKGELLADNILKNPSKIIAALKQNYSESMVLWVAAVAIYPNLQWYLTLYIGKIIVDCKKESALLSIENLFEIVNLPWFVEDIITFEIRKELLQFLQQEHPSFYEKLIAEVKGLLSSNDTFKENAPILPKTAIIGLESTTKEKNKAEIGAEGQIRNFTQKNTFPIIQKLTRKQNLLDFIVPSDWRQYLKKLGFPNLGMQDFWKDVLFLMLPLWILFLGFVWSLPETWDNCKGEIIAYQYEGEVLSLCIDSPQDKVLLQEYQARDAIKIDDTKAVDSLTNLVRKGKNRGIFDAILSRDESDVEPLRQAEKAFFGNIGTIYYNKGVTLYEDSKSNDEDAETKANNRDQICYLFDRAIKFDSLDMILQKAVRWCIKNQIKSVTLQGQILDAETQQAIRNAKVTYLGQSTATNSTGHFTFSINQKTISQQKATFSIKRTGYLSRTDSF